MWRAGTHNSASASRIYPEDYSKYSHPPPRPHTGVYLSGRLVFTLIIFLFLALLLLVLNVVQVNSLGKVTYIGDSLDNRPVVLVYAQKLYTGYLDHVLAVFNRIGYLRVESAGQRWDVLWSHDYPFAVDELDERLKQLEPHQKVNHFPGSGFITNKASLAVSHFPFHPLAFEIPKDKKKFLKEVAKNPQKIWVEKSNMHRGIHIKKPQDINLDSSSRDTFVEEFISNPYLIDKRKCDLGIYTVLTSINPLRVYVYEDEILIRCCIQDYHPLDVTNEKQYVVGDEYTQPWELDSLRYKWKRGKFSRKQMLFTHLTENGKDADKVWLDIKNAIKEVYSKKEVDMIAASQLYRTSRNFFEMVRFDFILDENAGVWLMEVNMSPNLSSGSHIDNAVLYEQVIFNLFGLVGVANKLGHGTRLSAAKEREMQVTDMDIMTSFDACATRECRNSCSQEICELCHPCLTEDQKVTLKLARLEHVNRGGFRRVVPPPMSQSEARVAKSSNDVNGSNRFMWIWFRRMCLRDPTWCH
ncbi:probable tubulin polyglutamylase ttll-15 isoform X2 [Nematostella vectensis]|uniref:probable tubulin polyglutamylase ttll-15 isoform X2 n=1 Tax=Nematostella vectensis TaxID=45351 RepID=UPI002076DABE|nr:probable tubulin polyglutamylase ttll-15 isoform X2 [Nematostella vectensis]